MPKGKPKENKIEYSAELTKLLGQLKISNPTPLQDRMFKELNQEEREIYMAARKKKAKADRKKLFKLINKSIHKRG